jgi:2-keto-4-pentenoate hydratase/2-oxohepta-3-ene-1,7-dioic acid hydratase in catechol pathway
MKYCRFQTDNGARFGKVERVGGEDVVTSLLPDFPEAHGSSASPGGKFAAIPFSKAKLLAPVEPSKIVCVGRNYREHASELGSDVPTEPLIFFKPPSSIIAPEEKIQLPPSSMTQRVDYEGELGVVIGKRCGKLAKGADVRPYIRGYVCVNDVTARDIQKKDDQWTRAKGFDTFCPVGPLVSDEADPFGAGVELTTRLNGELRQKGNTREFIFGLDILIHYISQVMTLEPGDLIPTGTPAGVGPVKSGDVIEVTVSGVGTLRNSVV